MHEHRQKLVPGFTSTYNITWLAYYEITDDIYSAIGREKQIKAWRREKKLALVETMNPGWRDLSAEWDDAPKIPHPPWAGSE
jgi:putative endonuclease